MGVVSSAFCRSANCLIGSPSVRAADGLWVAAFPPSVRAGVGAAGPLLGRAAPAPRSAQDLLMKSCKGFISNLAFFGFVLVAGPSIRSCYDRCLRFDRKVFFVKRNEFRACHYCLCCFVVIVATCGLQKARWCWCELSSCARQPTSRGAV